MVSAWAGQNHIVLEQVKVVDEKSNEITAIPRLLELLVIKGCIPYHARYVDNDVMSLYIPYG
jgi:hypothetical protein